MNTAIIIPTEAAFIPSSSLESTSYFLNKGSNFPSTPTKRNEGKNIPAVDQTAPEKPFN